MLPFARFPGADPVLGPGDALHGRGDGERRRLRRPRSRRPSAPPGAAADGRHGVPLRARPGQGRARAGRRRRWPGSGSAARDRRHRASARRGRARGRARSTRTPAVVDPIRTAALRPRRQHAQPEPPGADGRLPDPRGGARRRASRASPPSPARPPRRTRSHKRAPPSRRSRSRSGSMPRRERRSVVAVEAVGPYTLLRVDRGGLDPGVPGQFFMLEAPGRLLPRPISLCLAPARRARVPRRPDRPRHARRSRRSRRATASPSSARSATASGSTSRGRCSSAAGSASRPSRTSRRRSAPAGRCSASGPRGTPRRPRSSRTPRS